MLGLGLKEIIILAIGFLFGGLVFSKDFRVKFFKGFRSFISNIGKGAQEQSKASQKELGRMQKGIHDYGKNVVSGRQPERKERDVNYKEH